MLLTMRVICTLPNASALINGVPFETCPQGRISGDLTAEEASGFADIPGYTLVRSPPDPEDAPAPAPVTSPRRGRPPRTPV